MRAKVREPAVVGRGRSRRGVHQADAQNSQQKDPECLHGREDRS